MGQKIKIGEVYAWKNSGDKWKVLKHISDVYYKIQCVEVGKPADDAVLGMINGEYDMTKSEWTLVEDVFDIWVREVRAEHGHL
jgi:hypothetical protein